MLRKKSPVRNDLLAIYEDNIQATWVNKKKCKLFAFQASSKQRNAIMLEASGRGYQSTSRGPAHLPSHSLHQGLMLQEGPS